MKTETKWKIGDRVHLADVGEVYVIRVTKGKGGDTYLVRRPNDSRDDLMYATAGQLTRLPESK